ncbi:MAG: MFS transporter, partial [Victivallales bacterium]|nr:MFS transporter [Victivallales bacterium]
IILFFLRGGLSFASIGILVSFREICVALLEIPSGAAADVFGRKKSMIISFASYIVSFLIFYYFSGFPFFLLAMFFFSIGESFRTGTHKSMIFSWLKKEGRENERASVYGQTRSWSKFGSAFSLPVAVALVFITGEYSILFLACCLPYLLNIINVSSYPSWLDFDVGKEHSKSDNSPDASLNEVQRPSSGYRLFATLRLSLSEAFRLPRLRRILLESMCYGGVFKTAKDYIQPILVALVVSSSFLPEMERGRQIAVFTGFVYFILHLLSGLTSARAGRFRDKAGGDEPAATILWRIELVVFLAMGIGILSGFVWIAVVAFVALALLQNLWRPLLVGRCAACCSENRMATLLSIESQAKSLFICVFAPLVGWAVDTFAKTDGNVRYLPVAILGVAVSIIVLAARGKTSPDPVV